jgi:hypothetical protein
MNPIFSVKRAVVGLLALSCCTGVANAQEILFQDKFENVAPGASPLTGGNGWYSFGPGSAGLVSVETDTTNRFGYGTDNQYLRINENIGFFLRTQRFSSEVVTASFDFIDDRTSITSGGAEQVFVQFFATQTVNPDTGVPLLNNADRAHLAIFRNGGQIVGSSGTYPEKTRIRVDVVMNNQPTYIVYDSPTGPKALTAERADVWINGVLVASDYASSRGTTDAAKGPVEMVTLQNFSTDRFNGAIDNFTIFSGAHVLLPLEEGWTPPPPPARPIVLLQDNFNNTPAGSAPLLRTAGGIWNSIARPDGIVVTRDTENRFGYGSDNHYLKIDNIGGDLRGLLSEGVEVATISFDFIDRAVTVGDSATNTERSSFSFFGGGLRLHNLSLVAGSIRGTSPAARYAYHGTTNVRLRADVVVNNSADSIEYTSPAGETLTLAPGRADLWFDGVRVSSDHTLDRATTAVPGPITEIRLPTSSSTHRYSIDIDNFTIFRGARVLEPIVPVVPREEPEARELLVYEGFDYPQGGLLDRNAGLAWAGPYRALAGFDAGDVSGPGLTYSNLVVSGNRATAGTNVRAFRTMNTTEIRSERLTPLAHIGRPGSSVWVSFVAEGNEPATGGFWGLGFYRGTDEQGGEVLFIGKGTAEETRDLLDAEGNPFGGWKIQGGTATLSSGIGRAFTGVPYTSKSLWVIRIDFNELSHQQAYLFRNPGLSGAVPVDSSAVGVITIDRGNFAFDRIRIAGNDAGFSVDELRIGTTWHSVVPTDGTAPAGFAAWQEENFSGLDLGNPGISGPSADPDGDGLTNLVEYALGSNPRVPGRNVIPQLTMETMAVGGTSGSYLVLTYNRPNSIADIAYAVKSSSDLVNWMADAVQISAVDEGNGTTTYSYRSAVPVGSGARSFLRLEISQQ